MDFISPPTATVSSRTVSPISSLSHGSGSRGAEVTKAIELYLPELHWDKLEQTFPHWTDVINKGALGEQFRAPEQKEN